MLQSNNYTGRPLSLTNFRRIADAVQRESGIELPDSKLNLTHSRLLNRLRQLGMVTFSDYCDFIEDPQNAAERLEMLSVLTTNVTGFYREAHHFEFLLNHGIPPLAERLRAGGSVRVWSAGCSSGEEPYSIALTFLQALPEAARLDLKILATDIDPRVLNIALRGAYFENRLAVVPSHLKRLYFHQSTTDPKQFQACPELQNMITFRHLNLTGPWPFSRPFDVIFCRNVVIYFDPASKTRVWERMIAQLAPNGLLMTGHSERLSGNLAASVRNVAPTTYTVGDMPRSGKGKV